MSSSCSVLNLFYFFSSFINSSIEASSIDFLSKLGYFNLITYILLGYSFNCLTRALKLLNYASYPSKVKLYFLQSYLISYGCKNPRSASKRFIKTIIISFDISEYLFRFPAILRSGTGSESFLYAVEIFDENEFVMDLHSG
jgi:hypothetical protein